MKLRPPSAERTVLPRHPLRRIRSLAGLGALLLASACGGDDRPSRATETTDSARFGGSIVVGISADLETLNPLASYGARSKEVQRELMFMTLLRLDRDLRPAPWLATSWDTIRVAPDSLQITFQLRHDVFWHDGTPTTAEDVLFTFQRAVDPATRFPSRAEFEFWDKTAEVVDSFTIRFRLRPHADFLAVWSASLPVLPSHLLRDVAPGALGRHEFGTSQPVGNGPFRFVSRDPGKEWTFAANSAFPADLGGRPYLDEITFRVVPDAAVLLSHLMEGAVDVYISPAPAQVPALRTAEGIEFLSTPARAYHFIAFNARRRLFADANVRKAISMAIDRQELGNSVLNGQANAGVSTATPAHWTYPIQQSLAVPYDQAAAAAVLAEQGWRDRDGDGVLENESGRPFRFTLTAREDYPLFMEVAQVVQAQLGRIGVAVDIQPLPFNRLTGTVNSAGSGTRDYDAVLSSWTASYRSDESGAFHSRNANDPRAVTGFTDPRLDLLMDTVAVLINRERAQPLWADLYGLLIEEAPYAVLYYPQLLLAHRERVHGVGIDVRGSLESVTEWWLE